MGQDALETNKQQKCTVADKDQSNPFTCKTRKYNIINTFALVKLQGRSRQKQKYVVIQEKSEIKLMCS